MRALFSSPVTVWLGKAGNTRVVVNNALYAAKLPDEEWPGDPDKATQAAIVACHDASHGGDAEKARRLFETTARKAGILDG